MRHPFRKKWGQNFLRDPNYIRKIIATLDPQPEDIILEIGPGDGALTNELASQVSKIIAIEIDPLLVKHLNETCSTNVNIIEGDILDYNFYNIPSGFKILGNLPYYITSPIIFKIINNDNWETSVLMVQQEVGERITANPGRKIYGRMSVMIQTLATVKSHFKVPSTVFQPRPNVDSIVISLQPLKSQITDPIQFSRIVKLAFSQRRKKLKNTLGDFLNSSLTEIYGDKRPEQLSVDNFILISESISSADSSAKH